jgi:hypothetical protein
MKRKYSLFAKDEGKWIRLSTIAIGLQHARTVFQSSLISGSFLGFEMGLRPVKSHLEIPSEEADKALAASRFVFKTK